MKKRTCNYCFKQMDMTVILGENYVSCCSNPECPVFALLQVADEDLPTQIKPKIKPQ